MNVIAFILIAVAAGVFIGAAIALRATWLWLVPMGMALLSVGLIVVYATTGGPIHL